MHIFEMPNMHSKMTWDHWHNQPDSLHPYSKAHLICDQMLEWHDKDFITTQQVKSLFNNLHNDIKLC